MELLPDELRSRLPPRYTQEADDDPVMYAHYFLPESGQSWYVCEGQPKGEGYLLFGFVSFPATDFREFLLSELQAKRGPLGQTVERDLAFNEGRFTDVVPAPAV
jgi:Protein of unknown function (DUF2958)